MQTHFPRALIPHYGRLRQLTLNQKVLQALQAKGLECSELELNIQ
jgi:hypothetical protein